MNFIRRVVCGFVALGLCLAMAATTFGSVAYDGYHEISTTVVVNDRVDIGDSSPGEINVVSGGSFTCDEARLGEDHSGTVNVQVGGIFNINGETEMPEGSAVTNRLNVYGTAYVEQLKMYGGDNDTHAVVGNGTDAATLTILEGQLGRDGDSSITINANATMIITGDWDNAYTIDEDGNLTDSYIDLVGGTLEVNALIDTAYFDSNIKGNGVLGDWVMTFVDDGDDGINVYTAVAASAVPEPSTFALAALGLLGLGWFGWRRKR